MPIDAANHTAAAVVRFVTLRSISLFRISPAPRKPIPVITWAAILDDEPGSTTEDRKVKIIAPHMPRQCVLIPTRAMPRFTRNSSS